MIHWELCKKLKFNHITKWYMHKPESVRKNETHKNLWDFEIQADHLILARRPSDNAGVKNSLGIIIIIIIIIWSPEGKTFNIFQEDALSPFLFVITMMPLNYILKKCTRGNKFSKLQEKINHLMYDIKLFAKNVKELKTLIQTIRIYSQDTGMEFDIEKCAMLIVKSGKRQIMERIELPT